MIKIDPYTGRKVFTPGYKKPNFKYLGALGVTIPGSSTSPSYYIIDGREWIAERNLECVVSTSGLGGLSSGTVKASTVYYLYVVMASDVLYAVADERGPTEGPNIGYPWTYIGSFGTGASSTVVPFISVGGTFRFGDWAGSGYDITITNTTPLAAQTFNCPSTAYTVYVLGKWNTSNTVGMYALYSATSTGAGWTFAVATSATEANEDRNGPVELAMVTPKTAYFYLSNAGSMALEMNGWQEDPSEYS